MTTLIDLRSDTLTQPTAAMKAAMLTAPLGDDVYNEDPSVRALEEEVAALCGKQAGLFCPSLTMANQIAMGLHLQPGDAVLGHPENHVFVWEAGSLARLWGATYQAVTSRNPHQARQVIDAEDLRTKINPDDPHYTRTRLVTLENTLNRGGGAVYPLSTIRDVAAWAKNHDLALHLDGARLWNAMVATNTPAAVWAKDFDTVAVCLSKGLGCPVGAVLVGHNADMRQRGVRLRKALGGGMRQAGMLAAAGSYALAHHVERLAEDHAHAQSIQKAIEELPYLKPQFPKCETNIVWFEVTEGAPWDAYQLRDRLREQGILVTAFDPHTLRAVTHLDISRQQVDAFIAALGLANG